MADLHRQTFPQLAGPTNDHRIYRPERVVEILSYFLQRGLKVVQEFNRLQQTVRAVRRKHLLIHAVAQQAPFGCGS